MESTDIPTDPPLDAMDIPTDPPLAATAAAYNEHAEAPPKKKRRPIITFKRASETAAASDALKMAGLATASRSIKTNDEGLTSMSATLRFVVHLGDKYRRSAFQVMKLPGSQSETEKKKARFFAVITAADPSAAASSTRDQRAAETKSRNDVACRINTITRGAVNLTDDLVAQIRSASCGYDLITATLEEGEIIFLDSFERLSFEPGAIVSCNSLILKAYQKEPGSAFVSWSSRGLPKQIGSGGAASVAAHALLEAVPKTFDVITTPSLVFATPALHTSPFVIESRNKAGTASEGGPTYIRPEVLFVQETPGSSHAVRACRMRISNDVFKATFPMWPDALKDVPDILEDTVMCGIDTFAPVTHITIPCNAGISLVDPKWSDLFCVVSGTVLEEKIAEEMGSAIGIDLGPSPLLDSAECLQSVIAPMDMAQWLFLVHSTRLPTDLKQLTRSVPTGDPTMKFGGSTTSRFLIDPTFTLSAHTTRGDLAALTSGVFARKVEFAARSTIGVKMMEFDSGIEEQVEEGKPPLTLTEKIVRLVEHMMVACGMDPGDETDRNEFAIPITVAEGGCVFHQSGPRSHVHGGDIGAQTFPASALLNEVALAKEGSRTTIPDEATVTFQTNDVNKIKHVALTIVRGELGPSASFPDVVAGFFHCVDSVGTHLRAEDASAGFLWTVTAASSPKIKEDSGAE